jgi:hypothetical protein
MINLPRDTSDFLKEVESVSKVKGFIVGVIVSIGFLEKERPYLHTARLIYLLAVDEVRLEFSFVVFKNRDEVVDNNVFPDVLLKYFY